MSVCRASNTIIRFNAKLASSAENKGSGLARQGLCWGQVSQRQPRQGLCWGQVSQRQPRQGLCWGLVSQRHPYLWHITFEYTVPISTINASVLPLFPRERLPTNQPARVLQFRPGRLLPVGVLLPAGFPP